MANYFWCGLIVIISIFVITNAQTYERFNYGVFNQVNRARHNPRHFGHYLDYDLDNRFPDDETSNEICLSDDWHESNINSCDYRVETMGGREWYEAAIYDLRHGAHHERQERLDYSPALSQMCYDLISQQGPAGTYGHIGEDGSDIRERIDRYANRWTAVSEMITYSDRYGRIGSDLVKQLLLDDGIENLSHRTTILNPSWTHLGVSCGCHATYAMTCCIAFGIEVETDPAYTLNQVADQQNSCNCTPESFGDSLQEIDIDPEDHTIDHSDIRLVHHRSELSEVSYDSTPATAVNVGGAYSDNPGNSTLTYFTTRGIQEHNDQFGDDTCSALNLNTTASPRGEMSESSMSRLQIRQEDDDTPNTGIADGLSASVIARQINEHAAALEGAEETLGENIGNTTSADDPGYTGVAVPSSYENRARHRIFEELNRVRSDPQGYAEDHYQEGDPQYDILMSHDGCDDLDWSDELSYACLGYVNEAGPCGTDSLGTTPDGYTLVDYFLTNFEEWGYTTFGLLYGGYYHQDPMNVVGAIIEQMGEEYLFNCYYEQFGMGCACSSSDAFTCAYVISSEVTEVENQLQPQWMPIYGLDQCPLLCPDIADQAENVGDDGLDE